ncbi:hypothetical protein BH09BAC2_BH09BAC2_21830 [soil metagenome]
MDSRKNIQRLLTTDKGNFSKWFSYIGLAIGVLLLLSSVQMFININNLLKANSTRKNGYDFVSVTKVITNENMGKDNTFKANELSEMNSNPAIETTAPLLSNQFRVKASAGNIIPFSTDLFLESIKDEFIDTVPPTFKWQPGDATVPIIFSSDFLEMYNVFAPSQDLPQLSDKTISAVNINLECYGPNGVQTFKGNIIALSDRINSILVPESFMSWANQTLGGVNNVSPSRIYIKTKDANNPAFLSYLDQKDYHLNKEKTKFGRIKKLLQNVVTGLGIFGILVIILALMLFSFYLQLMIAKSKQKLQLLLTIGYSPDWLSKTVARTWIPVYITIVITAIILTSVLNYAFVQLSIAERNNLPIYPHWSVLLLGVVLLFLSIVANHQLVKKELSRITL